MHFQWEGSEACGPIEAVIVQWQKKFLICRMALRLVKGKELF